jgi:ribonucleoside-diphosphate reductase beta chain
LLYSHLIEKLPEVDVHNMFKEAVQIESDFVCEALKVPLIGINSTSMTQYIQFVSDMWLQRLGYSKLFNVTMPFEWMNLISMPSKTNFFEKRVPDYAIPGFNGGESDNEYGSDDEF